MRSTRNKSCAAKNVTTRECAKRTFVLIYGKGEEYETTKADNQRFRTLCRKNGD
jgi:hypothetical protein